MPSVEELLVRLDATSEGLRRELRRADSEVASFESKTNRRLQTVDSNFDRLGKNISKRFMPALAGLAGAATGRSILSNIMAYEKVEARLRRLTDGTEDYAQVQAYLRSEANRLNTDIFGLADGYARLLVLQNSGIIDRDQVNALSTGLADAAAALGQSDLSTVMYGLSQALSSPIVRAEELNQVVEPLPGLLQEMDKAAQLPAGGFRKMVADGKITSDFFATTMVRALKSYEGAASSMEDTFTGTGSRIGNSWKNLSTTMGDSDIAGILRWIGDGFADVLSSAAAAGGGLQAFDDVTGVVGKTTFVVTRAIQSAWNAVQVGITTAAYHTVGILNTITKSVRDIANLLPGIEVASAGGFEKTMYQLDQARIKQYQQLQNSLNLDYVNPEISVSSDVNVNSKTTETKPKKSALASSMGEEEKAIQKVVEALKFRNEQIVRSEKDQELYNQLRAAGVSIDSAAGQEIQKLVEEHDKLSTAQEKNREKTESLKDAAKDLGLTFTSAFEDAVIAGEDFGSVMEGLFQDISRVVLRKGVTEPVAGLFSSFVDGIDFGGLFGFANGGIMTGGGSVPLRRYATGGIATSPQLAMFGEGSMPEAYVPLPDGRSIPVTMRGASGGGGTMFHQNINIDARGADDSFTRKWPAMEAELIRKTKAAVAAEANRGGAFSKAVGRRS